MDVVSDALIERPQPIVVSVKGDGTPPSGVDRVELDLSKFHNGRWALQLDATFSRRDAPVILLAHGVACLAVSWWAQLSPRSYLRGVKGALLHAPLTASLNQVAVAAAIRSGPTFRLPFPSVVVGEASFQIEQVLALADKWGSCFVELGGAEPGQPSNRRAPISAMEALLLDHLPLLAPRAGEAAAANTPAEPELMLQPMR